MNEWKLIVRAVRSRWWVILIVAALVAMLVGWVSSQRDQQYEATARVGIQVPAGAGETSTAFSLYEGDRAAESKVATYAELVDSDRLLEIAAEGSDLAVDDLRDDVVTSPMPDTVLFDVTATANSFAAATAKADAVASAYPRFVAEMETPADGATPLLYAVVMDDADGSGSAIAPTNVQITILGVVGGLALGLGVALLAFLLDKRIRRVEDLEEVSGDVPAIGEVPVARGRGSAPLINFHTGYSPAAEAMRTLRTQVRFLGAGEQVHLVTSAVPGEGKSFIASNLARSFVEAGDRVLLINADLRAPSIERAFHLSGVVGLSNVLAGQIDASDVIIAGGSRTPDIIPAGPIPPNPSELLGHDRMKRLLAEARKKYDVVIIDTPPLTAVTDTLVLVPQADAVIMVARIGTVKSTELAQGLALLRDAGTTTCGIVANGTAKNKLLESGYGYGYGHPAELTSNFNQGLEVEESPAMAVRAEQSVR